LTIFPRTAISKKKRRRKRKYNIMLYVKKTRRILIAAAALVLIFLAGVYVGFRNQPAINKLTNISGKETVAAITADFSPFWEIWNEINDKYPGAAAISDQERVYGAIAGLVGSLNDPYSVFFKPEEAKMFEEDIAGTFQGIGVEVGIKDKVLTVIAPLKGTPGYKAGVQSGDQILKIDETVTTDITIEKAIELIRGEAGSVVTLTILREKETRPIEIKIVRDTINVPTLDTELRLDGIFVIKLYSFSANAADLFRAAIREFAEADTDKMLLDLRGNPGGYLDSAVDMASWFLPGGKTIVIEDYGGENKEQKVYRSRGYDVFTDRLKMVILIDGGSASASEILAGALQDHDRAKLVGTETYGKGSVQEVVKVTSDTLLKITVAKWLTPNGVSISETGLTPDYKVEWSEKDFESGRDPQMNKALELLLKP